MPFTEKQRQAILARDNHECQFPACPKRANGSSAHVMCTPNKLNVHHILPQRYSELFGVDPNFPENALSVCAGAHIRSEDGIHPDMARALQEYRDNPRAVAQVFEDREEMLKQRKIYWNDKWDRPMSIIATKLTQDAEKAGWQFPEKRTNGHPTETIVYQSPQLDQEVTFEELQQAMEESDEIKLADLRKEIASMSAAD